MPADNYIKILLVFLIISLHQNSAQAQKAPDFSLKGSSKVVRLSDYHGNIVYLDFWASWCKPCRKSFPFMNEIQKKYQQQGLRVIGVNLDPEYKDAQKFLKTVPAEFILAYDPKGITTEKYQVTELPTSYLIDQHGQIIYTHKGFKDSTKNNIETKIIEALTL